MITTTEFKMDVLRAALSDIGEELKMDIYDMSRENRKEPLKFGVNWSACGTVDYKRAYEYAANLEKAAEIAEMITDLQLNSRTIDIESPKTWEKYDDKTYKMMFLSERSKIRNMLIDGNDVDLRDYMEDCEV